MEMPKLPKIEREYVKDAKGNVTWQLTNESEIAYNRYLREEHFARIALDKMDIKPEE